LYITEKLTKVFRLISHTCRKLRFRLRKKPHIKIDAVIPLMSHGTRYGGWKVPENFLDEHSVCYLAGAGIDISFDVEVAKQYGSCVYILDPTPSAREHFDLLIEKTRKGEKLEIENRKGFFYNADSKSLKRLVYLDIGLWKEDTIQKFYVPGDANIISHSILNIHHTDDYFEAEVVKPSTLMKRLSHNHIDYLKLDIEGAEYAVLESVIEDNLSIGMIAVEYDEVHHPLNKGSIGRIENSILRLKTHGYLVIDVDSNYNVTFMHKSLFLDRYPEESIHLNV
jgi:FkbM family methyltransferase